MMKARLIILSIAAPRWVEILVQTAHVAVHQNPTLEV